ncbi:hypothetical protein JMJ77_0011725, partial [Colletotrichum scovillei]
SRVQSPEICRISSPATHTSFPPPDFSTSRSGWPDAECRVLIRSF